MTVTATVETEVTVAAVAAGAAVVTIVTVVPVLAVISGRSCDTMNVFEKDLSTGFQFFFSILKFLREHNQLRRRKFCVFQIEFVLKVATCDVF